MAQTAWNSGDPLGPLLSLLGTESIPSISGDILTVDGVTQAELDNAMAEVAADPEQHRLKPVREARRKSLISKCSKFVETRYTRELREMFQALLLEAVILGLPNRIAYISQLLAWIKSISQLNIAAEQEIDDALDIQEIRAVEIDFDSVAASDPQVTVKEALQIMD
jgi:hypothetical protein